MTWRPLLLAAALPAAATAQVAVGDSLWRLGRLDEAAAAYRRAIADDPQSVRANIRLAQTLAWGSNIDSALILLRNARQRVPDDPDIRFQEALYLSWARRFDESLARYDSLLAMDSTLNYVRVARARTASWAGRLAEARALYERAVAFPGADADSRRDAAFGLAQVAAWSGDLRGAATRYEALLADDPTEVRVLVGLAGVRNWQGRYATAEALLDRALARDSANADARQILESVRRGRAPRVEVQFNWSEDSDGNRNAWQLATQTAVFGDGLRWTTTVGRLDAGAPGIDASRMLGETGVSRAVGNAQLTAAVGARWLASRSGRGDRSALTWRAVGSYRVAPWLGTGVSISRVPFDEIASLIERRLDFTATDVTADLTPRRGTTVSVTAGRLGFSDDNARQAAALRATQRLPRGFFAGTYLRQIGFTRRAPGYFSPARFVLAEVFGGWGRESRDWELGASGGVGRQQPDTNLAWQDEWHLDARIARRWGRSNWVELFGGASNSLASSAVGAFRYESIGLSARIYW